MDDVTRPEAATGALRDLLAAACPPARIDLVGAVTLPVELPHRRAWLDWVERGRHAGLEYLARDPQGRADPTRRDPWARSLLVFAQRYTGGWTAGDRAAVEGIGSNGPWLDGVARYARGRDYHDVLKAAIEAVLERMRAAWPGLRALAYVDTGPFLEREYALLAGLGFVGKNTCLIHESLGSGLFLGVALTDLAIPGLPPPSQAAPLYAVAARPAVVGGRAAPGVAAPDAQAPAVMSRCGSCTRCLEACPTGALDAPYALDARRCLATWTIEWHGRAPAGSRREQGGLVFGCDICQAVCPWNHKAARTILEELAEPYRPLPEHAQLDLADLLALDEAEFRQRLRRTPLWRAHPAGLRRNALVAAANAGRRDLHDVVARIAREDPDPEVRDVAAWAARQLDQEA